MRTKVSTLQHYGLDAMKAN